MREIKFRAWCPKQKEMMPPGIIEWWFQGCFAMSLNPFNKEPDLILMQYTGLRDKNGKEIYEGSIVKYKSKHAHITNVGFDLMGIVEYNANDAAFVVKGEDESLDQLGWAEEFSIEVIGNIYEDKRLLQ